MQYLLERPDQGTLAEGGRLSTVDLLVITSLDQLLLILKNTIYDFTILLRRSIVLNLTLWLVFPGLILLSSTPFGVGS